MNYEDLRVALNEITKLVDDIQCLETQRIEGILMKDGRILTRLDRGEIKEIHIAYYEQKIKGIEARIKAIANKKENT